MGWYSSSRAATAARFPAPPAAPRRRFLEVKWEVTACRERQHQRMLTPEKLWHELLQAFRNQGPATKRKHDMHKMAEANSAVGHYRWWQTEGKVPRRSPGLSAARNNANHHYIETTCALSMSFFFKGGQVSRKGWSAMFISLFFEELELTLPAPSP